MDLYDALAKLDLQVRGKHHALVKIRAINATLRETKDALIAENAATEKRIQEKLVQEQAFLSQRQQLKMELESLKKVKDEYFLRLQKVKTHIEERQARKTFLKNFNEKKLKQLNDIYEKNHKEFMSMPHVAAYEESKKKLAELQSTFEEKQVELTKLKKEIEVRNNVEKEIWKQYKNICIQAAGNWKKKQLEEEEQRKKKEEEEGKQRKKKEEEEKEQQKKKEEEEKEQQKKKEEEEKKQLEVEKLMLMKKPTYELPKSFFDKFQNQTKLSPRSSWIPNKSSKTQMSSILKSNTGNKTPSSTYKPGDFASKWKELQDNLDVQRTELRKRFLSQSASIAAKEPRPCKIPRLDNLSVVKPLVQPVSPKHATPRKNPMSPMKNSNELDSPVQNDIPKNGGETATAKLQNETEDNTFSTSKTTNDSNNFGSPEKTPSEKSTLPPASPRKSLMRTNEEFTEESSQGESSFNFYGGNGFTQENGEEEQAGFNLDGSAKENDDGDDESMSFQFSFSNSGTNGEGRDENSDLQDDEFGYFNYSSSGYGASQSGSSNGMDTDYNYI